MKKYSVKNNLVTEDKVFNQWNLKAKIKYIPSKTICNKNSSSVDSVRKENESEYPQIFKK